MLFYRAALPLSSRTLNLAAELGDVLEVLQAIAQARNLHWDHVLEIAAKKRTTGGAFNHRLYLEHVEAPD
jgi:hypothetical protein